MAIGSGLAAQLGLAVESTRGTYVAPTRFHPFHTEDLKKVKNTVQGGGLAAGRGVQLGAHRVVTTEAGAGSFNIDVTNKSMGILLNHLMGGTVTPVQQAATTAYLQTHALADNVGKYLTIQKGVPDASGTVRPYAFKGSKIVSAEFSCGVDEILTSTFTVDAMQVTESDALATASYTTATAPFHFGQMAVKTGTYASETTVSGVKKATIKIERPQDTDRFYAGATVAGTKAEPLWNAEAVISGTLEVDYLDKTKFADLFAADTSTALVVEWVGPLIASTYYQTFRIKIPQIFFDEGTPAVGGPEVVNTSFSFVGQYDGTNVAATIEYMSVDTSL